jgi:phosphatidylcholine synthase
MSAWLVHFYTASGAVAALLATRAIYEPDIRAVFLWLAAAAIIDSTDGWLARAARVRERTPEFDGARLDDIVDYLTFVFVPVLVLLQTDTLEPPTALPAAAAVLLASAYGFARVDAKTDDYFFTGFPSYWNVVAFYLVALGTPPGVSAAILFLLAALVFVRVGYVYPSRTPLLRGPTLALGVIWGLMVAVAIWQLPAPSRPLVVASLFFPIYYVALSLYLHSRRTTLKSRTPGETTGETTGETGETTLKGRTT